ncbi:cytochrome P450 [Microbacterium sp. No. 7]|uniref:cytochrome P450 n=1 Tax=Microbacterium sp. No. 7 TaxID=1714373 RepID=UPI0006D068E8|nr:cytochrome P450 [Microbacterium sp. No. 7]ALJ18847.1 hypothetical protein AOA12_02540 [Microbacterium sp. No. 7]
MSENGDDESAVARIEQDLGKLYALDPGLLADPYPLYRRMREHAPVLRVGPMVSVSRYDDIKNVLRDTETFTSQRAQGSQVEARLATLQGEQIPKYRRILEHDSRQLPLMDDPAHARLRRFVAETFSAKRIAELRETIFDFAYELLDEIDARGDDEFDLIGDYSFYVPFRAICHILNVPREDAPRLRAWGATITQGISSAYANTDEAYDALVSFSEYVQQLIDHARAHPGGTDLISELVNAQDDDGVYLTDTELVAIFVQMLVSGNTNTLIANALVALEEYPEQRQALLEDPTLIRPAIEEFIRYRSSIQAIHRVATTDTEIAGFPVRENETVRLLLASGNHDSDKFENGEVMDIRRKNARQHIGIGFGVHTCLGQWLFRLDAEAALAALFERHPDVRISGEVVNRATFVQWGPERLLVSTR